MTGRYVKGSTAARHPNTTTTSAADVVFSSSYFKQLTVPVAVVNRYSTSALAETWG